MRLLFAFAIFLMSSTAYSQPPAGQSSSAPKHECDTLTSNGEDTEAVAPAVAFKDIKTDAAIGACKAAVSAYPGERRFKYQLGRAYRAAKDFASAIKYYTEAANQGHVWAAVQLSSEYQTKREVEDNEKAALVWLKKAAESGDRRVFRMLGHFLAKEGYAEEYASDEDLAEAAVWYQKAAELGDKSAMYSIGLAYEIGRGIQVNYEKAINWYLKCVDAKDARAMLRLAWLYQGGLGVQEDKQMGVRWLERAAEVGAPIFKVRLADELFSDSFGAKDLQKALKLYEEAAGGGNKLAMRRLADLYATGVSVQKDLLIALDWYKKAAEAGDTVSAVILFAMYKDGEEVPSNPDLAAKYSLVGLSLGMAKVYQGSLEGDSETYYKTLVEWPKDLRIALQRQLKERALFKGPVDGQIRSDLLAAIRAYMKPIYTNKD